MFSGVPCVVQIEWSTIATMLHCVGGCIEESREVEEMS